MHGRRRDIRDVNVSELRGFDAIVHLAELSNDPLGDLNHALTRSINQYGTARLAKAARDAGVRRFCTFPLVASTGKVALSPAMKARYPGLRLDMRVVRFTANKYFLVWQAATSAR